MPRTAASEIHSKLVGRELRRTRQELGLTQVQVAERLGVSASYIAAVEAGRRNLTLGQLANIANAIRPNGEPVLARRAPKAVPASDGTAG